MAVAAKPAMVPGRDEAAPFDPANDAVPAVLIDPEAAEILAGNASGGAALGLFSYASFPVALDPAMPAIARLRQIATSGPIPKSEAETLLFWNSGRLKRVKCKISKLGGKGSRILLLHIEKVEQPADAGPMGHNASAGSSPRAKTREGAKEDAAKHAETRSDAVGAFDPDHLAKLAHELKTPLTAIAAAAEIMRDQRLGEMKNARYLRYAADIHESATHALDVISSLLANRAKADTPASRLIAIDLNAIVERTVSSVQALAESCGLKLTFATDVAKLHVAANPTALRQVLLNLLTNAIKFTPQGGSVGVATGATGDGRVFLIVRDTGCGMGNPPAPSARAGANSDLDPQWARGYGIGLPLVEALVRDMGAEIRFESSAQTGTTATILFSDFAQHFK